MRAITLGGPDAARKTVTVRAKRLGLPRRSPMAGVPGPREAEALRHVNDYTRHFAVPPPLAWLARRMGLTHAGARAHVRALELRGLLEPGAVSDGGRVSRVMAHWRGLTQGELFDAEGGA